MPEEIRENPKNTPGLEILGDGRAAAPTNLSGRECCGARWRTSIHMNQNSKRKKANTTTSERPSGQPVEHAEFSAALMAIFQIRKKLGPKNQNSSPTTLCERPGHDIFKAHKQL